ncbi:MAG TPA: hypothetical protein VG738_25185 [Chitinophagaceae bacterium]|nr:hypothetical protein [Chitinophagaceae bacterium]
MKRILITVACTLISGIMYAQAILVATGADALMPEHGFLPGRAFKFYPALEKYDFGGKKLRVEIYDERDSLKLTSVECSTIPLTNSSEFKGVNGAEKVVEYFDTLFRQSNIIVDSLSTDTLKIHLLALDNRMIGFGNITAHGLCQLRVEYKGISKGYCEDITDKSPHSPIGKNAFVTRKTATRVIQSASLREIIEQILVDLKSLI